MQLGILYKASICIDHIVYTNLTAQRVENGSASSEVWGFENRHTDSKADRYTRPQTVCPQLCNLRA